LHTVRAIAVEIEAPIPALSTTVIMDGHQARTETETEDGGQTVFLNAYILLSEGHATFGLCLKS